VASAIPGVGAERQVGFGDANGSIAIRARELLNGPMKFNGNTAIDISKTNLPLCARALVEFNTIKKGARDELPSVLIRGLVNLCDGDTAWGTLNLSGVQTSSAHLDLGDLSVDDDPGHLEIRLPDAARSVVGVRDVVSMRHALVAHIAAMFSNRH